MGFDVVPLDIALTMSSLENLRKASHNNPPCMCMGSSPEASSHISRGRGIKVEGEPHMLVSIELPMLLTQRLGPEKGPNDGSMLAVDGGVL